MAYVTLYSEDFEEDTGWETSIDWCANCFERTGTADVVDDCPDCDGTGYANGMEK